MKNAVKNADAAKVGKAGLPSGVKIVGRSEMALDAQTIRKILEGWALKKSIDEAKQRLEAIHAELIEAHGTGCALVVTGVCRASLALRESVKIEDGERLRGVLGDSFDDLVKTEVTYKPEKRLIAMACDGDEPLQPAIGVCLAVSQSQAVTWRAER